MDQQLLDELETVESAYNVTNLVSLYIPHSDDI